MIDDFVFKYWIVYCGMSRADVYARETVAIATYGFVRYDCVQGQCQRKAAEGVHV